MVGLLVEMVKADCVGWTRWGGYEYGITQKALTGAAADSILPWVT